MVDDSGPPILWQAQPGPQAALVSCPIFEVFFGGARGGGKTDGCFGDWMAHSATFGEAAVGVFFRRTFVQLSEAIARSQELFPKLGAKWRGDEARWVMPGGARLMFRHLDKDADAENYQGHNYTRLYFEELTNYPSPAPINKLKATLRSKVGAHVGMRATGNPGGPGHNWVKHRYITPCPTGYKVLLENYTNPFTKEQVTLDRVFIPSKLSDNRLLMENDPQYVARLYQAGSKQLVQAWLMGEWDIIDGAYFDEFNAEKHILPAEWLGKLPPYSTCFRAMDWGFAKPYSIGWYVVSDGSWGLPPGAIIKFWELYGSNGQPNVGVRQNADIVAGLIRKTEEELWNRFQLRASQGVIDPAAYIQDGGPSIGETMAKEGVMWMRADNKRIPGWQQVRARLTGAGGRPLLYFLETCNDSIRTLPTLQHDDRNMEDLDTDGEDHAADELRYACMSRPWITTDPKLLQQSALTLPKLPHQYTFMELVEQNRRRMLRPE